MAWPPCACPGLPLLTALFYLLPIQCLKLKVFLQQADEQSETRAGGGLKVGVRCTSSFSVPSQGLQTPLTEAVLWHFRGERSSGVGSEQLFGVVWGLAQPRLGLYGQGLLSALAGAETFPRLAQDQPKLSGLPRCLVLQWACTSPGTRGCLTCD